MTIENEKPKKKKVNQINKTQSKTIKKDNKKEKPASSKAKIPQAAKKPIVLNTPGLICRGDK